MRASIKHQARLSLAALVVAAATASAQLGNASSAATGLGGAFTARATGYNAVYWNPANLAMAGNPGFSLAIAALDGQAGIKPIDFQKVVDAGNKLSSTVREQWLVDVESNGTQNGGATGGLTELALSIGHFGFQVNTKAATLMDLSPGATEAILFGNAGRDTINHTRHDLNLAGSGLSASGYTTAAASIGIPFRIVPLPNFSVGVTGKYIVGHGVVVLQDVGSTISSDVNVDFPAVMTDTATLRSGGKAGSGMGLDLGAAWTIPGFRFGVSMQNVVNTFKWDTTLMVRRHATAIFSATDATAEADTLEYPFASAPLALREKVAAMKFKPVFAAGVSFDWLPRVTVSADIRQQVGDGIETGPASMIGAGAELKLIPFIPLRGGVQMMSGGFGLSGGVGVHLLGFELGVAGYLRKRDGGTESGGTLNVFSIRP